MPVPEAGWHSMDADAVLKKLNTSEKGLKPADVGECLSFYGPNRLEERGGTTPFDILVEQFKDFLILLLMAAAAVSLGIGFMEESPQEMVEAGLILVIVAFIVVVGFYQQYSAEKELEALKKMMSPQARVLRDGVEQTVDAADLVPGDVVLVEAGTRVPADIRLLEAVELKADESSLTGESTPVNKGVKAVEKDAPLAERSTMLYTGTSVVYGKGRGVVVSTGMRTEFGSIASRIQEIKKEKTPLQDRLGLLGKQIGVAVIVLCAVVFFTGVLFNDEPVLEMFIVAIALAVAAVPEGLPGVVTVALGVGTRRMVKENVIIRKLPAVETLGSTTVICTDKTGTLTKNEMTVKLLWVPDRTVEVTGEGYAVEGGFKEDSGDVEPGDQMLRLLEAGVLCNNARLNSDGIYGDPTEGSVLVAGAKAGLMQDDLNQKYPRADEIPFSSERKRKTTVHEKSDGLVAYTMGAPDVVLELCSSIMDEGGEKPLDEESRNRVLEVNAGMASKAYRVLAFAYRKIPKNYDHDSVEGDMVFLGLTAMIDPPREESRPSVQQCRDAGIRIIMVTGDHQLTAKAIAEGLGISSEGDEVLNGRQLEEMSDDQLLEAVDRVSVYARVSPIHKLRIVEALQSKGNVVAMTGDGVNDAPALKKADIGVAMGITGTDVSKEAADMVLTDDNFASIVRAVEEGRGIYDNIRKFFAYLISGNIGEVAVVFLSSLIPSVPIALTASQILIINLVTDGLPALALGVDPFEPGAMKRKPRSRGEPLHRGLSPFIAWYPLLMIMTTMALFMWVYDAEADNMFEAQTVAFLTIAFFEMYQAFASRSTRYPAFKVGILKNKWLLAAVGLSLAVVLALVYVPLPIPFTSLTMQELTHVQYITPQLFLLVMGVSSMGFIYLELQKWWNTRSPSI